MKDTEPITLPGGFEHDGEWQRAVWLRRLVGHDEMMFAERSSPGRYAENVTVLIGGSMLLDPGARPAGPEFARALTVGDREAILLHLRRLALGDEMACWLTCPSCSRDLDLDVTVSSLLLPPYPHGQRQHRVMVMGRDGDYEVCFRLPNGSDQECASAIAFDDAETAALLILRRCLETVAEPNGRRRSDVPTAVREELPAIMAALDPQAELLLTATCPECSEPLTVLFDAAAFLRHEMGGAGGILFREVHRLALHYHWSESDILALTPGRRRRYLRLLSQALPERHGE